MFELADISPDATDAKVFKTSPTPNVMHIVAVLYIAWDVSMRHPGDPFAVITNINRGPLALLCVAGALILGYLWCLVRPVTLITNGSVFVLTGGFLGSSEIQPWNDVERFFINSVGGKQRVACALKPNAQRRFWARFRAPNAKAIFACFFPADPEQTVAQLNALRQHAIGYTPEFIDGSPGGATADHRTVGTVSGPVTIRSSRWIYVSTLIIFPAFLFASFTWLDIKGANFSPLPTLGVVMFVAVSMLAGLWVVVHPPTLRLDEKGFTLTGGFARSPETTFWKDVQDFFVYNPPRSYLPKIAYDSRSEDTPESESRKWASQKVLFFFYVTNADKVVNQLNAYRQRALGLAS